MDSRSIYSRWKEGDTERDRDRMREGEIETEKRDGNRNIYRDRDIERWRDGLERCVREIDGVVECVVEREKRDGVVECVIEREKRWHWGERNERSVLNGGHSGYIGRKNLSGMGIYQGYIGDIFKNRTSKSYCKYTYLFVLNHISIR